MLWAACRILEAQSSKMEKRSYYHCSEKKKKTMREARSGKEKMGLTDTTKVNLGRLPGCMRQPEKASAKSDCLPERLG